MEPLYPEKKIKKKDYSGKIFIDADMRNNCLQFRFEFDSIDMVHPLLIWVKAFPVIALKERFNIDYKKHKTDEIIEVYECIYSDFCDLIKKTDTLNPKFNIKDYKILVTKIESKLSFASD